MAMDTVTGHWSGGRSASGVERGAGGSGQGASMYGVVDEVRPRNPPVAVPLRRSAPGSGGRRGPAVCADSHAPDLHGSRLTPRGRVVVAMVWLVMAAVAALMLATVPGDGSQAPAMTTKVMVEPGETLWQLAGDVQPTADRHDTIAAIMTLNGLGSASQVRPGDILIVPVQP